MTPAPPEPFDAPVTDLPVGQPLYRVHDSRFTAVDFNPGVGGATRFACFPPDLGDGSYPADDPVPVLYAASGENAAVAETLLHDVPLAGGTLGPDDYQHRVMSRIEVTRQLRLAGLHGLGLARLGVTASQVTSSPASSYPLTVRWAAAAHAAGFDGVAYMSRMCNDTLAYVFFGDRCRGAFAIDITFARVFGARSDLMWLIELCAPLRVDVLPPH